MVYLMSTKSCNCETCNGGTPAPPKHFGGSRCVCPCHTLKGQERLDFIEQKKKWDKEPSTKVEPVKVTPSQLDEFFKKLSQEKENAKNL